MTPRQIIAEAWRITAEAPQLRRWGYTSSFFETLFLLKLLVYQVYFVYEHLQGGQAGFFDIEIALYRAMPFWGFMTLVISFIVLLIIEFFTPSLCKGAIIGLGAKVYRGEEPKGGLVMALYNFFSIFAIHELFVLGSIPTVITAISLMLRYVDEPIRTPAVFGIIGIWCVATILKFFFSFAEEAAVISKLGVFTALGKSYKLVVTHLSHVMFLILLLFMISLRIVLNAISLLLIPAIVIGLSFLLARFLSDAVSNTIAGSVGVVLVFVVSYFFAYIEVFKQNVWTITYLELHDKKDVDVIL